MNKRAELTFYELIKGVIALIMVFILVAAGVKIYNITHPEKYSVEKKDLLAIVREIKDLKSDNNIIVPIFSKDYTFELVNTVKPEVKSAYGSCNLDYCACFKKDTIIICETFNLDKTNYGAKYKEIEISNVKEVISNTLTIQRIGSESLKLFSSTNIITNNVVTSSSPSNSQTNPASNTNPIDPQTQSSTLNVNTQSNVPSGNTNDPQSSSPNLNPPQSSQPSENTNGVITAPVTVNSLKYYDFDFSKISPENKLNYVQGIRNPDQIKYIILHHTATINYNVAYKALVATKNSVHYMIEKDGTIHYLVDEKFKANHAGAVNGFSWNDASIGIEIVNTGYANDPYTDEQYEALNVLIPSIISRWPQLSFDDINVRAHYESTAVSNRGLGKFDPSPNFKWGKINLPDHKVLSLSLVDTNFGYTSDWAIANNYNSNPYMYMAANELENLQNVG